MSYVKEYWVTANGIKTVFYIGMGIYRLLFLREGIANGIKTVNDIGIMDLLLYLKMVCVRGINTDCT